MAKTLAASCPALRATADCGLAVTGVRGQGDSEGSGEPLGDRFLHRLGDVVRQHGQAPLADVVVPVPLHKGRARISIC